MALVTILFVGGGQDVIARMLDTPVGHVTTALQLLAVIGPPITWLVTWHVCKALQHRPPPDRTERAVAIVRDPAGGYHTIGEAAPPTEAVDAELHAEAVTEPSAEVDRVAGSLPGPPLTSEAERVATSGRCSCCSPRRSACSSSCSSCTA